MIEENQLLENELFVMRRDFKVIFKERDYY